MKYYQRQNLMRLGVILLLVAVFAALFTAIGNASSEDDYKKVNAGWIVGGLDKSSGLNDKNLDTRMTSDYIEIKEGFKVQINSKQTVEYEIYLYDDNKNYVCRLTDDFAITNCSSTKTEIVEKYGNTVKYIRVVMSGFTGDDNHIGPVEKLIYSGYLKIFVTEKEQVKTTLY